MNTSLSIRLYIVPHNSDSVKVRVLANNMSEKAIQSRIHAPNIHLVFKGASVMTLMDDIVQRRGIGYTQVDVYKAEGVKVTDPKEIERIFSGSMFILHQIGSKFKIGKSLAKNLIKSAVVRELIDESTYADYGTVQLDAQSHPIYVSSRLFGLESWR